MHSNIHYLEALDIMSESIVPVSAENIPLSRSCGRVLAVDLTAAVDIPPFDRSPYDGYAFRTADTLTASSESPVTLTILEEVAAGSFPTKTIVPGTAVKILTGGPVPEGADGIIKYEYTRFTEKTVTLFEPVTKHDIVRRGEDVRAGELLMSRGGRIDPAAMGTLAAQGIANPLVYKIPKIGILSTGNELAELEQEISGGQIRNTNRYMLEGAIRLMGAEPFVLSTARDNAEEIASLLRQGLEQCDAVISTGGVSVGDYDATPAAMELAGAEIIVRRLDMKPGGPCAYGVKDGKAVFALSGNPAAAIVNFYALVLPCLRKLCGLTEYMNRKITVTLADDFKKPSPQLRLLRGTLDLSNGQTLMRFSAQGNSQLHAIIGCDVLAVIPAGTQRLDAGTRLDAYLI